MAQEAAKIKAFATGRQKAYLHKDRMNQERARSITHILKVADHFRDSEKTGWIHQIKEDILSILPSEEGRFKKQRASMLELISKA